jgi:hypothetical protein
MKRRMDGRGLASELAGLPHLDREALLARWHNLYGTEPPYRVSQQLLVQAIAYRLQEQELGGLKPSIRRFLAKAAEDTRNGQQISAPPPLIKPGTRLLREWHGITHEVTVMDDGVMLNGKKYKSLSEVAQLITGVKWSGPLFFGLRKKEAA